MAENHPLDIHLGQRLRLVRNLRGLSQTALAKALKLTFQQVQKYEKGDNRISARTLHQLSHLLNVPRDYFFEGYEDNAHAPADALPQPTASDYRLLADYHAIPDTHLRNALARLIKDIARAHSA